MAEKNSYHHGNLRESALEVTREIVARNGHDAVTMRALAAQLDVTPGALYRHFSDRAELLGAVANHALEEMQRILSVAISDHVDPCAALRAAMSGFLTYTSKNVGLFKMIYDEAVLNAPAADEQMPALAEVYRELARLLKRAVPTASPKEIRLRMIALWSTLFGYATIRAHHHLKPYMVQSLTQASIEKTVLDAALVAAGLPGTVTESVMPR